MWFDLLLVCSRILFLLPKGVLSRHEFRKIVNQDWESFLVLARREAWLFPAWHRPVPLLMSLFLKLRLHEQFSCGNFHLTFLFASASPVYTRIFCFCGNFYLTIFICWDKPRLHEQFLCGNFHLAIFICSCRWRKLTNFMTIIFAEKPAC